MRRLAAVGALVVLLVACAPGTESPIGGEDRICRWVRESVKSGAMPVSMAQEFYPWCGPYKGRVP